MTNKSSIGIKWKGPLLSHSGYGQANRDYVSALHNSGFKITTEPKQVDPQPASCFGDQGKLVMDLKKRDISYDFVVHHQVPIEAQIKIEHDKINIAYNTWETDKLPEKWIHTINRYFDLQLVPSEFNKELYIQNGIKIRIEVLPHCVDVNEFINEEKSENRYDLGPCKNKRFKFLSVFQWTERKNPIGLLKAYFSEFYDREDVVLILKTYRSNTSKKEIQIIKNEIEQLKNDMRLKSYPPIYLIGDIISKKDMISIYNQSDCFVMIPRAEGFGIPFAEACAGRCICIAPNYSGHVDFLKPLDGKSAFLTNYQMTPVAHMNWIPNYDGSQSWAEPDIKDTGFLMKHVCDALDENSLENRKTIGREFIQRVLSPDVIANMFYDIIRKYL